MTETPRPEATPNRWIPSPAARLWLYSVLVALAPIGVAYGIMTAEESGLWLTVASALLGAGSLLAAGNVPKA